MPHDAIVRQRGVAAHEVAHGAFNLRHTFSNENAYFMSQSTSDNLMDYSGATADRLNKYQWDFIHDPESMLFVWLQDEEEGEMWDYNMSDESIKQLLETIRKDNIANEKYTDLSAFAMSSGTAYDLQLSSDLILEYLQVEIGSGKNIGTEENPFLKEALTISPMELKSESVSTPSDQEGNFVKVYYHRYDKATLVTGFVESDIFAVSFVIKESQEDEFEEYLHSIKPVNLNINWVSQFDEDIFGLCSGCWTSTCCRRAAEYMMGNTNIANCTDANIAENPPYMAILGIINTAGFMDNTSDYTKETYNAAILNYDAENLDDAIQYMKDKLNAGRPILIGVHYTNGSSDPPSNSNRATRHFMVIVGMGMEGENMYFNFYDPGRTIENQVEATSTSNKLILNRQQGSIEGTYNKRIYTITEIIKTN